MRALLFLVAVTVPLSGISLGQELVRIGSKTFTESYVLAELIAQEVESLPTARARRDFGLGATAIVYTALRTGSVDLYPEYTGTIAEEILQDPTLKTIPELRAALASKGLTISDSLGFNNTYALAMKRPVAARLGIIRISDLAAHPELRVAVNHEFLNRRDGFRALLRAYGLHFDSVRVMEHALTYEALAADEADLIEVYSTDAKIRKYDLLTLEDDRRFFPKYWAVLLARAEFCLQQPEIWEHLRTLEGSLDESDMIRLNSLADLDGRSFSEAVRIFQNRDPNRGNRNRIFWRRMGRRTGQHLFLVLIPIAAATSVGIPLGIIAARLRSFGQGALILTGLCQTIPSLALLCFLIPLLGTGWAPALVALFLYGLLPIVRNTHAGLMAIDPELLEAADAINLTPAQRLLRIELPLAAIPILTGIKTATIINVGTATIAALIGAGGYGAYILEGLSRNDIPTILLGAGPSALLALLLHVGFERLDHLVIPKGLRLAGAAQE